MMIRKQPLAILAFLTAFAGIAATSGINGVHKAAQPPVSHTGASGEENCTACHSGTANSGAGSLSLSGLPADGYVPGQTYTLAVTVNDQSQPAGTRKYGFESTALNASNQMAGTWGVTNAANTATGSGTVSGGSRSYIGHKTASSSNTWSFSWTAPATDAGTVTFYVAGNAANGTGSNQGDLIYTNSFSLAAATSGRAPEASLQLATFPNPACDYVRVTLPQAADRLDLMDNAGHVVRTVANPVAETEVSLAGLPVGVYLLRASLREGSMASAKVVKE